MELGSAVGAIVTGGASGLGEATARALAGRGVKVAIFDMQKEKGERVTADIKGVFCEVNVTDDDSVSAGFKKARAAHGQERAPTERVRGFWLFRIPRVSMRTGVAIRERWAGQSKSL